MELGVGTVQFGLDYGVSNASGKVAEAEVRDILALAEKNRVLLLDTAAAYGDSETVLGRCLQRGHPFRVVTKTIPLRSLSAADDPPIAVREGVSRSLDRLAQDTVYGLLVHHASDLLGPYGDVVWGILEQAKNNGQVTKIGSSVYEGVEIDALLDRYPLEIVQMPLNVFDQRLLTGGQLQRLKDRGVEVHARSVFLQGLLLMEPAAAPAWFEPVRQHLVTWRSALDSRGLSPARGALAFVRSLTEVDVVLTGVESAAQLAVNIENFAAAPVDMDFNPFALNDERFVNPSCWRLAA